MLTADTPAVFRVIVFIAIPRVVRTRITGQRWRTPLYVAVFSNILDAALVAKGDIC